MSANVEFNITAFDQASSVFEDVDSSAQECFTTITTGASEAADSAEASSTEISTSMQNVTAASNQAADSQNLVADSAQTLGDNQAIAVGGLQSNDQSHAGILSTDDGVSATTVRRVFRADYNQISHLLRIMIMTHRSG